MYRTALPLFLIIPPPIPPFLFYLISPHPPLIPPSTQHNLLKEWNRDRRSRDMEDVLRAAAHDPDAADTIAKGEALLTLGAWSGVFWME